VPTFHATGRSIEGDKLLDLTPEETDRLAARSNGALFSEQADDQED
jgi:hypothetical protein